MAKKRVCTITIQPQHKWDKINLCREIHHRLVGKEDYVKHNINVDDYYDDRIIIYVYEGCKLNLFEILGD